MASNANTGLGRRPSRAQNHPEAIVLDDGSNSTIDDAAMDKIAMEEIVMEEIAMEEIAMEEIAMEEIVMEENLQAGLRDPTMNDGERKQRRANRKRDRQEMSKSANTGAGNSSSDVIELLDDSDDDDENDVNVIDLSTKPAAVARTPSPVKDGEIEVLDGPQRKPPPGASAAALADPPSCLLRVLEIFPDANVEYVKTKLREQRNNIEIVVAILSENSNYPKQKKSSTKTNKISSNTLIRGVKSNEPKHDYSASSKSFEISTVYETEVMNLLLYDFTFFKVQGLHSLLSQHDWRYTLTRNHIHDMIVGKSPNTAPAAAAAAGSAASANMEKTENENYQLLRSVLVRGKLPQEVKQRMGDFYCLKKPRRKIGVAPPGITDPILLDEHCAYERKFQEWVDGVRDKLRAQAANKLALENGTAVTCSCCFDDVAMSECVPCKEKGHLFCKECIVQYVESQVFGSGNLGIDKETKKPALELKCCEGSGCNSGFRDELLKKVLSTKTWQKYSEMQANAHIQQAGLGGNLAMCPKCGYQAEVPEMQNIFECPVEHCQFVSCRKCGRASHIPLRCEEVAQQDRQDEGRLKIEEALTQAKIRTCPKCKKNFIKSDGCNKMTCACGMKICYVCRAPLNKLKNPYAHFCQEPHCDHSSCGRCKLYSKTEEDDELAMREAGIAAKEAYEQKLQTEDGEAAENLKLSVDEIMGNAAQPKKKKKKSRHRGNDRNNQNRQIRPVPPAAQIPPVPQVPPLGVARMVPAVAQLNDLNRRLRREIRNLQNRPVPPVAPIPPVPPVPPLGVARVVPAAELFVPPNQNLQIPHANNQGRRRGNNRNNRNRQR